MEVEAWLSRAARADPERVAVQAREGSWTYAELLTVARDGAAWLAGRGAVPGSRVGIALPPGLGFVQALHACLLLGAAAVPVDVRLAEGEQAAVTAGCHVVVREPLWEGPGARASSGADPPAAGAPRHDLDGVLAVVHTSGTTSAPRPVELSYGNFLWSALGSAVALGLDRDERWLCALPVSHVGGLSILLRSAIYGTTAVVHERFDTELVLGALAAEGVTLVSLVATTLARLLDAGLTVACAPRLRCCLTGGGPVPAALLARAREAGIAVAQTYGLTESCSQATTVPVAALEGTDGAGDAVDAGAGPPLFCTRVEVASDGEILLAGPTLARGALDGDGRLHTGDLGRLDAAGRLHVTGRKADTIVTGGENVAPAEVEAVLEAHPSVLEAAVVAREHAEWGEAVTALVVLRDGSENESEAARELREHCRARLGGFKVPREVVFVAGPLPRTRSGKLLRRELA